MVIRQEGISSPQNRVMKAAKNGDPGWDKRPLQAGAAKLCFGVRHSSGEWRLIADRGFF